MVLVNRRAPLLFSQGGQNMLTLHFRQGRKIGIRNRSGPQSDDMVRLQADGLA